MRSPRLSRPYFLAYDGLGAGDIEQGDTGSVVDAGSVIEVGAAAAEEVGTAEEGDG
jgi:hypothetical protein